MVPFLTYSSEIWGYQSYKAIEDIQLNFCKYLLAVNSKIMIAAIQGQYVNCRIFINTYVSCVKYLAR